MIALIHTFAARSRCVLARFVLKQSGPKHCANSARGLTTNRLYEEAINMAHEADTRILSADQAKAAFAAYADLVRAHAGDPDTFDDPDRIAERLAAHAKFTQAYEAML